MSNNNNNKLEKRRGRPPKNMILSTPIKNKPIIKYSQEEEQLVLYLPSFDDEKSDDKNDKNNIKSIKITKETTEDFNDFNSDANTDVNSDANTDVNSDVNSKFKYFTNKNDSDNNELLTSNNINIDKLIEELRKKDDIINNLKSKLKDKSSFNNNILTLTKENKKQLLNIGLITINKNKINICEKTNIACWWCSYNFDSQPLFMPDHYKKGFYHVFGNYCSFACMFAYNENLDDYRKSVRTVLIKQLYREIFNCDDVNIKSAGPRELLEKFGGPMSITKFRDINNVSSKIFKISIPPMIPLISEYEEIILDK